MISPLSRGIGIGMSEDLMGNMPALSAWPAVNEARYYAIYLRSRATIQRFWVPTGSALAVDVSLGIYSDRDYQPANLIVGTGTVTTSAATSIQYFSVTTTTISPGLYWLAMSCNSTSMNFYRSLPPIAAAMASAVVVGLKQDSAHPLPSTATPVVLPDTTAGCTRFLFGFSTTSS